MNKAILSIDGVDEAGITTIHPEESAVAAKMIERARRTIIIADGSKIGKDGFCTICPMDRIDLLITNQSASPEAVDRLREMGVNIKTV